MWQVQYWCAGNCTWTDFGDIVRKDLMPAKVRRCETGGQP